MNQSEQEICQLSKRIAELESQMEKIKKEQAGLVEQLITIKKFGLSERLHQYLDKTERAQKLSRLIVDTAREEDSRSFTDILRSAEQVQLQETLGDLKPEQPVENRLEAERYSRQMDAQLDDIEGKLDTHLGDINWDDIFEYQVTDDGIVIHKYIAFEEEKITVPPYIKGIPVVGIGNSVFENCKNTSTVFLPDSVKTIGEKAFYFSGITTMRLPKQLNKIEPRAFCFCPFTEIVIPDGVQNLECAFSYCSKLNYISLPRTLNAIGKGAFEDCESLEKIDIPMGVTIIGEGVFQKCNSLLHVRIPDTVSQIGKVNDHSSIFGFMAPSAVVIYCNARSIALQYARKYGIKVDRYENYPKGK